MAYTWNAEIVTEDDDVIIRATDAEKIIAAATSLLAAMPDAVEVSIWREDR